jgi:hypothetical protein
MRNLHDPDGGISKKADRAHQEIALRNEVGIENRDKVSVRFRQGVIDISGLGVRVIASGQISSRAP